MNAVTLAFLVVAGFSCAALAQQSDFCQCLKSAHDTCRQQLGGRNGSRRGGGQRGGRFGENGGGQQRLSRSQHRVMRDCMKSFFQDLMNTNNNDQCNPMECMRGRFGGKGRGRSNGNNNRSKRSPGRGGPKCPDDIEDQSSDEYQRARCMYDNTRTCFRNANCPSDMDPCSQAGRARVQLMMSKKDECYQQALQSN